jgi:uncharacterized damage-inducible protein DinB
MDDILTNATAVLSITPEQWMRLVQTVPDKLFRRPAVAGQWSALECLHHLTAVENTFFFRLTIFLEGGREFSGYDPDSPENKMASSAKPASLADEFARRRATSLKALGRVTKGALERSARHAELGQVTMEQFLHEWAAHDLNHTVQAERALMQPFIQGSGPWARYFVDHLIPEV